MNDSVCECAECMHHTKPAAGRYWGRGGNLSSNALGLSAGCSCRCAGSSGGAACSWQ